MSNLNDILPQGKLSKAFTIIKKIGEGSFGVIYSAKLNERKLNSPLPNTFAIKIEKINKSSKSSNGTLMREARLLYKLRNSPGFPKIFYSNTFEKENILIIEELGKNLENLFEANNKKFSAVCVSNIAIQALSRLRELSKKGIVHRDLKPDNFLIGQNENIETIYLIDFGLSKNFNDDKNKHIEFSKDSGFIGTPRYASINSHLGYEQSRRDDLETLAYMMVYFLKGKLPWMNLNYQKMIGETKEINPEVRNKLIMKYKMSISSDALFKELPIVFHEYFKYTKTLEFKQEPDYDMLIEKFEKFLKDKKASYKYDWDVKLSKSLREESLVISFLTIDREISNLNFDWLDEEKNPLHLERNNSKFTLRLSSKLARQPEGDDEVISIFEINADFMNDISNKDEELPVKTCEFLQKKVRLKTLENCLKSASELLDSGENVTDNDNEDCPVSFLSTKMAKSFTFLKKECL